MRFVDNSNVTDPHLNLALEEYLLRQIETDEPLFLLYVNEPAVIIGRNQNVFEEIDPSYIKNKNIHLVRRLSGGGTVYHDLGNLNYSFITPGQANLHKFERATEPIIRVLRDLGVGAEFRGRSDIVIGENKISGNAQYASRGRMFSHGTLLFDADLEELNKAIKPANTQIESKAVQSVRSSVRNFCDLLPEAWTTADLKQAFLTGIFGPGDIPALQLTSDDWDKIRHIAAERYMSWDWNIGRSPRFTVVRNRQYPGGAVEVQIEVEKGSIKGCAVKGTLFSEQTKGHLEAVLQGLRYDPDDLLAAVRPLENELLFASLSTKEFVDLLY